MIFSKIELRDLLISSLAITFIFAYPPRIGIEWLFEFGIYFVLVGLSFSIHEVAHKLMAISRGAVSEFRMWAEGLGIAILMRVVGGAVFIAPGATYWSKPFATKEDYGLVSAAGPASNIALALVFLALSPLFPFLIAGASINSYLALFNLIPFPPLDGSKIIKWQPLVWGGLLTASLAIRFFTAVL